VFRFHLTDPTDLNLGARRPRDNPDWPEVGIFGHRNMRSVNWLGVSRCRLLKVDGLDLHVEDLDAVDGTPVLDIKPWFAEMAPAARSASRRSHTRCCATTSPSRAARRPDHGQRRHRPPSSPARRAGVGSGRSTPPGPGGPRRIRSTSSAAWCTFLDTSADNPTIGHVDAAGGPSTNIRVGRVPGVPRSSR